MIDVMAAALREYCDKHTDCDGCLLSAICDDLDDKCDHRIDDGLRYNALQGDAIMRLYYLMSFREMCVGRSCRNCPAHESGCGFADWEMDYLVDLYEKCVACGIVEPLNISFEVPESIDFGLFF